MDGAGAAMTAAAVAQYLRVTERTVCEWADKGSLPGQREGEGWSFSRPVIETWLEQKLQTGAEAIGEDDSLAGVLTLSRVVFLEAKTKDQALSGLVDVMTKAPEVKDAERFRKGIFERETLMSTGIGLGIGLPHVRLDCISNPVIAAAKCIPPLEDYEALDGEPVWVIFMIGAHLQQHTQHIKLLSQISRCLKSPPVREALQVAPSPKAFMDILVRGRR